VLRLYLPALRERPEDLVALAQWSLKQACAAIGSRPHPNSQTEVAHCRDVLEHYTWPGNVRELRNVMERLALHLSAAPLQAITPNYLSRLLPELQAPIATPISNNQDSASTSLSNDEDSIDNLMRKFNNNREEVAQQLGISRTTLWRRLNSKKTFTEKKQ
jgi:propionate catabolism operon transcriptional regulator